MVRVIETTAVLTYCIVLYRLLISNYYYIVCLFNLVCELDIVFNFNRVYAILDEYILAGEIEETSKKEILDRVKVLEKLE